MKKNNVIAIDASRAFVQVRTGIEEYSYQVIKHLRSPLAQAQVVLYLRLPQTVCAKLKDADDIDLAARAWIAREFFILPSAWQVRVVRWRRAWTQGGLSLAMLRDRPQTLLVLAHTVPIIHPVNTIVVVHGLEYEMTPWAYSLWAQWYMRASIWFSVQVAARVVTVSRNTADDVARLYHISTDKMQVVYEGINAALSDDGSRLVQGKYFLFIGRLEERKNIVRIVEAFARFKAQTGLPHKLVLAGKSGYGYARIRTTIDTSEFCADIVETGFVSEQDKWQLLRHARAFVFPTLYEGFGLPVLEAQSVDTPVITSNISSLPEVAGDSALLVNPNDTDAIAEAIGTLATDEAQYRAIITRGRTNCARFSWEKCAHEMATEISRHGNL